MLVFVFVLLALDSKLRQVFRRMDRSFGQVRLWYQMPRTQQRDDRS